MTGSLFGDDPGAPKKGAAKPVAAHEEAPAHGGFVEVAIPVPLRRLFTYRVDLKKSALPAKGTRVAVPFAGRKLAGVVVGHRTEAPEGVKRVFSVAGIIEPTPVFTEELLAFLMRAADYYLHPVGDVLRAAAPALPADAMKRLSAAGFLGEDEVLPGARIGTRKLLFVVAVPGAVEGKLGAKQRDVLAFVREHGETSIEPLRDLAKNPRDVVHALAEKGLVILEDREVVADPFFRNAVIPDTGHTPNGQQAAAIAAIGESLREGKPDAFLLHGVTGSGKTEVYLRVIAEARAAGKGSLLLVPEIALTPQLVARFRARFGDAIAVLHSGLSDRERDDAWRSLRAGRIQLAVGARSALFAPVPNLGVIVVDEEHDPSFKQEEGFRYHARDMAMLRAKLAGAVCVMGSATPSIEMNYLAEEGKIHLLRLPERATSQTLPEVEIIDLARHRSGPSGSHLLSAPLHHALAKCLEDKGQAILFLNRRGFAPSMRCESCGELTQCPTCSVSLTLHLRSQLLRCHYCDFATDAVTTCLECGAKDLQQIGLGTEKLEDTLAANFPGARIGRLDRDTATSGDAVEDVLDSLRRHEIDILVGTQMVTKGHDIPGVTLVGVVFADQSLLFPDFRASERTFQLLSQVAGRAGRGEKAGHVFFQTYKPDHPAIRLAALHDYESFYRNEVSERRELGYVPFGRLVCIRVDAGDEANARKAAAMLAGIAENSTAGREGVVQVLGPAPAPVARIRSRFRFRILLRSSDRVRLRQVAQLVVARIDEGLAPARATVDVDPVSML